ncbi:MAG TPA: hypothetical protein V6D17_10415 [Candidatus Obscuribacterales bacterium]
MALTQGIFAFDISVVTKLVGWRGKKTNHAKGQGAANRAKYYVLAGDTLEQIAARSLGDIRYLGLLVTINRSQVQMRIEGGKEHPVVQPGQVIYLPTGDEVDVYRANFFSRRQAVLQLPRPEDRDSAGADDWSSDADGGFDSGPFNVDLLEAQTEKTVACESSKQEVFEPEDGATPNVAVVTLADYCRVLVGDSPSNSRDFSIRLQAHVMDSWRTIAAYYARNGRIARVLYRIDGRRKQIDVELPDDSVREMAEDDFTKNWERHYRGYMMQKPSSIWLEFPGKTI